MQLMAVLQVFGQALLQQDINIFKLSLASLEDLNAKWKLYLNVNAKMCNREFRFNILLFRFCSGTTAYQSTCRYWYKL